MSLGVYRLKPNEYVHVEDSNTCETITLEGPLTFTLYDHLRVLHSEPQQCVVVPINHFVRIRNPVVRSGGECSNEEECAGYVLVSNNPARLRRPREARCRMGQQELRFSQPPFPLFPGEKADPAEALQILSENEALVLQVLEDCTITDEQHGARPRKCQELFLFRGPGTYTPDLRVRICSTVTARRVQGNEALLLEAKVDFTDDDGAARASGEQWVEHREGIFFIHPASEIVEVLEMRILTPTTALHIRALESFTDSVLNVERAIGDEWLITHADLPRGSYFPGRRAEVVRTVDIVNIAPSQYGVIRNPMRCGKQCWGEEEVREGPRSFFLQPNEELAGDKVRDVHVLNEAEGLLITACRAFTDTTGTMREVASRWLVQGPCCYVPPLEVRVLERRRKLLLSQNDGVYVRNVRTGAIRSEFGAPFLLGTEEELWEKPVQEHIRILLNAPRLALRMSEIPVAMQWYLHAAESAANCYDDNDGDCMTANLFEAPLEEKETGGADGEVRVQPEDIRRYSVITVNVEHNALLRLHDMSTGVSRVVAGPASVTLEPHEQFVPVVLSGGRPKHPNQIYSLALFLGPDYMADVIAVETLDHARLALQLAYNWEFDTSDMEATMRIAFTMPDFIGEACKTLASRVRSVIAGETFENFHKNSPTLIKQAIFADTADSSTEVRGSSLYFKVNGMIITNVDVQSVEPVDVKTRQALTKSVQLAVEIITKSQESEATHNATLIDQEASGALELQIMRDKSSSEKARKELLEVIVKNATIEQCGASTAQAMAESNVRLVEAQADYDTTTCRCNAHEVGVEAELAVLRQRMELDLGHRKGMNELAIAKARKLALIEAQKYESIMAALGKETVVALAQAGPELQATLLEGLGLQGFIITDGSAPINLFDVAQQLTSS